MGFCLRGALAAFYGFREGVLTQVDTAFLHVLRGFAERARSQRTNVVRVCIWKLKSARAYAPIGQIQVPVFALCHGFSAPIRMGNDREHL